MRRIRTRYNNISSNSGFSLIELVIAVALIAVVGSAVFGFMTVGARTFSSTSSDVNLQSEAQLAFNQMQDLIIDTTVKIEYMYAPAGTDVRNQASYIMVKDDNEITDANCAAKRLVMFNYGNTAEDKKVYELTWERDTSDIEKSKLYYTEYNSTIAGDEVVRNGVVADANHVLMSEYIIDFKADLSRLDSRIVRIDTAYKKGNKEYESSHNITLRNKQLSANAIGRYTDTPPVDIPNSIVGPDSLYLMPGETLPLTSYSDGTHTGYVVEYSGHPITPPYGDQRLKFSINRSQIGLASGTTILPNGTIIVGKGQTQGFDVIVGTDFTVGNISKAVHVDIIRITNIAISASPIAPAGSLGSYVPEDETKEGWDKNLIENEEFRLTATVTVQNGNKVSATGATPDKTIVWTQSKGDDLFTLTDEGRGASDLEYTCRCKMNAAMDSAGFIDFDDSYCQKDIQVTAASRESLTLPYKNVAESSNVPVEKSWDGKACKRKGSFDIEIIPDGGKGFARGKQMVVGVPGTSGENIFNHSFTTSSGEEINDQFWQNHIALVEVRIEEEEYNPDGSLKPPVEITDFYSNDEMEETGNSYHFTCPMWYNPNAKYTYYITVHIAKSHDSEHQVYHILPYKDYGPSDYDYSSNTAKQVFDRLVLKYNYYNGNQTNCIHISDDQLTAVYYPRSFNRAKDIVKQKTKLVFDIDDSFEPEGSYNKQGFGGFEWAFYEVEERTSTQTDEEGNVSSVVYNVFDDSTAYSFDNLNQIFARPSTQSYNQLEFECKGTGDDCKQWDSVRSHLRLVPICPVTNQKTKEVKRYILFSNYIDIYLTNISIPGQGTIANLINDIGRPELTSEKSYFPSPMDVYGDTTFDVRFPGEIDTTSSSNAGEWRNGCYGYSKFKHKDTYRYTITKKNNQIGSEKGDFLYTLTLFTQNEKDNTKMWTEFASYECNSSEREWQLKTYNPTNPIVLN